MSTTYATADKYPDTEALRQDLIDEGIVEKIDNELMFVKSHIIYSKRVNDSALSPAASIILHGNRNGWDYWLLENGEPVSSIKGKVK